MTYAITTTHQCKTLKATTFHTATGSLLGFETADFDGADLHVPAHVANATAAAFNRAMQAVSVTGGWEYDTPVGKWTITPDAAMGAVYLCQHEDVDSEDAPEWLFAQGSSVMDAMDAIDEVVATNTCQECGALVGDDNLDDFEGDGMWRCKDCYEPWAKRQADMHKAAGDDKAHAAQEAAQ